MGSEPIFLLMAAVPEDVSLEVEAMVLNKDIGFVREGQVAEAASLSHVIASPSPERDFQ